MRNDHPTLIKILKLLTLLQASKESIFVWVPSHIGIRGNEKADSAAKAALQDEVDPRHMIPFTNLKPLAQKYTDKLWQKDWDQEVEVNNKLQQLYPKLSEKLPSHCNNRKEQTVLTRLKLGHSWFTHGYLLRGEEPPFCHACECLCTLKHILLECWDLYDVREKYFKCDSLYKLFREVDSQLIFSFLKEINIFYKI